MSTNTNNDAPLPRWIVATGWAVALTLALIVAMIQSHSSSTTPSEPTYQLNCGKYATEQAGGEAFKGSEAYNQAMDECEALNAEQ